MNIDRMKKAAAAGLCALIALTGAAAWSAPTDAVALPSGPDLCSVEGECPPPPPPPANECPKGNGPVESKIGDCTTVMFFG